MPAIDHTNKKIVFKIVYCGTALGGKTSNLRFLHSQLDPNNRTDLISLSTCRERTLFFDFMALESGAIPGYRVHFNLYTVPGQVEYNATMLLVLKQADGIVFVADSQMDRQQENLKSLQTLEANLRTNGRSMDDIPMVLQYNKQDLPNLAPANYMDYLFNQRAVRCHSFPADAHQGINVVNTLNTICGLVLQRFQQKQNSPAPVPSVGTPAASPVAQTVQAG
jgi:signal recognition particle receptor subunit beta